jgi:hypothetical protein
VNLQKGGAARALSPKLQALHRFLYAALSVMHVVFDLLG